MTNELLLASLLRATLRGGLAIVVLNGSGGAVRTVAPFLVEVGLGRI
ncbi:hypothetical protein [Streptomyces sp. NPDC049040]